MIEARSGHERLRELFAGQIENVFYSELGLADPELIAYLTSLLSRFVHIDAIFQPVALDDRRVDGVVRLLRRLHGHVGPANTRRVRAVHRYVGDFTLFWAGLYPEAVRMQGRIRGATGDALIDYMGCGKRSYLEAANLSHHKGDIPPRALLQRLSTHFELCAEGLSMVRKLWRPRQVRFLPTTQHAPSLNGL
ncbi:MAG: hypothetical protein BIFFINMI_02484 [Phycisphaerae bacterium]|nr:hypothetical protein [Phycisphaerae bacterium]